VVLEHREARGAELLSYSVGLRELLGGEVRAADRAHGARAHELVESRERLRDRRRRVGPVQVVEVDVVGPESLERAGDRAADVLGRAASGIGLPRELGREDDPLAPSLEELAQQALAAASAAVHLGRVEERDPGFEGGLDDRTSLVGADAPAEVVAPEPDPRDAQSALAQRHYLHAAKAI
jgi:hypothetical protein